MEPDAPKADLAEANTPPWATYKYTPTERGIFTPSIYKDALLPLWRFRAPALARTSCASIMDKFLLYEREDDFQGMDNARKFLQMGMTRAKRYANHKGGRKYNKEGGIIAKEDHDGKADKEEASQIFREAWEKVRNNKRYVTKKDEWLKAQKVWVRGREIEKKRIAQCAPSQ